MASWTTPPIHATGDVLSVTDWNTVANNETFLYQAPYCRFVSLVSQSIANSTVTPITLSASSPSFAGYGFALTSGSVVTAPLTGTYFAYGSIGVTNYGGTSGNYMNSNIYQNGVLNMIGSSTPTNQAFGSVSNVSGMVSCSASAVFDLRLFNLSSVTLTTGSSGTTPYFGMFYVGSQ